MSRRTAGNVFIEKQGPLSMEAETTKVKRVGADHEKTLQTLVKPELF